MSNEHDESQSLISTLSERLLNGLFKENPTFVLLLGMCPTLAVTTSAVNGLGMGVTTMVVLAMSNLIISALRKIIPNKVRIPAFIVIIASFVTIVELLMKAYIPSLYDALGIYIPLIVVNCIILGRAESYAYSHPVLPSLFDGIGMGMGFSVALTIIGAIREILGSGKVFGVMIMPDGFIPVSIFVMAPGAFFVLAILTAIQNVVKDIGTKKGLDMSKIQSGCGGNCMDCDKDCKGGGLLPAVTAPVAPAVKPAKDKKKDIKPAEKEVKADDTSKSEDKASSEESDLGTKDKTESKLTSLFGKAKSLVADKKTKSSEDSADDEANVKSDSADTETVNKEKKGFSFKKKEKSSKSEEETKSGSEKKASDESDEASKTVEGEATPKAEPEAKPESVKTDEASKEPESSEKPAESKLSDEPKAEAKKEASASDSGKAEAEITPEPVKKTETRSVYNVDEASLAPDEDDELEIIDLTTIKSASAKNLPSGRRPGKKTNAKEKAKAMLFKAEESVKEDGND